MNVGLPARSSSFVSDRADLCNRADPMVYLCCPVIRRERGGKTVGKLQGTRHTRPRPSSVCGPTSLPTRRRCSSLRTTTSANDSMDDLPSTTEPTSSPGSYIHGAFPDRHRDPPFCGKCIKWKQTEYDGNDRRHRFLSCLRENSPAYPSHACASVTNCGGACIGLVSRCIGITH